MATIVLRYTRGRRIAPSLLTWEVHHSGGVEYPHISSGVEADTIAAAARSFFPHLLVEEQGTISERPEFPNKKPAGVAAP